MSVLLLEQRQVIPGALAEVCAFFKRPENLAMIQALGIDVRTVTPDELEEFDALALIDVQPPVFGEHPPATTMAHVRT